MPSQSQGFQKLIIKAAQKRGELSRLFWAVEMERSPGQHQIALLDGRVPVVPLAPDVQDAIDAAQVLMYGLREGKVAKFGLCLLDVETLNNLGPEWYRYGGNYDQGCKC